MVNIRALSFSDDSVNVGPLSDQKSLSPMPLSTEQKIFPRAIEPAMCLSELRQLQSRSYEKLYKSSSQILEEPWPAISVALTKSHVWASKMLNTMEEATARLIHSDWLHSNILILSPPGMKIPLSDYGVALIFEYGTEYAEAVSWVQERWTKSAFWTIHDFQRVAYVFGRFMDILDESSASLFNGTTPKTPSGCEPSSALPFLGVRVPENISKRAISCLESLNKTMNYLGIRFGNVDLWEAYKARHNQILPNLRRYHTDRPSSDGAAANASVGMRPAPAL